MWTPVSAQHGPCMDTDWDAGPVLLLPKSKVEAQSALSCLETGRSGRWALSRLEGQG